MKKIIYIYTGVDLTNTSGVQKKILSKIKVMNELGVSCHGISFSNTIQAPLILNEYLTIIPYKKDSRKYFNSLYQQRLLFEAISGYLKIYACAYTHILFRYPLASLHLLRLSKSLDQKIVFEHNTKEIEEVELQSQLFRKSLKFSIKPGYFVYLLERGYFVTWQERFFGKKTFKYAKAGIAVTTEIAKYEKKRQPAYEVNVVANGIEVLNCDLRKPIPFNGNELKLFMLLGSGNSWHGIDRLVKSLENYKGDCRVTVDIIGAVQENDQLLILKSKARDLIKIIPPMPFSELDQALNQYHIGVGTLAAFRKGLKEATPLKTRECMARGFAVIVGYDDTDFMAHREFGPYVMKVPADESRIDFSQVIHFAENLYADPDHHHKIRDLAVNYLDTTIKMKELIGFLD